MATPVLVNSRNPMTVQAERMDRIQRQLVKIDEQIATGRRIIEAADDPAGTNRLAALNRMKEQMVAQKRSIDISFGRLGMVETAMESGHSTLLRAQDLALAAANDPLNDEGRKIIAHEVQILKEQLLDATNARDQDGRYLFGGAMNGSPPYIMDAEGVVTWNGFANAPGNSGLTSASGATPRGPEVFGDGEAGAFAAIDKLLEALNQPDGELRAEQMAEAIAGIKASTQKLSASQAVLGANMVRLDAELARISDSLLQAEESMANIDGFDMTAAITRMQTLQLTLSAAQASFTNIYRNSLFDRLA